MPEARCFEDQRDWHSGHCPVPRAWLRAGVSDPLQTGCRLSCVPIDDAAKLPARIEAADPLDDLDSRDAWNSKDVEIG
jgi:hypothetical protein